MTIASTDGVEVAVYALAGREGRPTLLMSHATGFHGHCYAPLAEELAAEFHSIGFDYRGHGDTIQPTGVGVDWLRYTDDAEAVALSLPSPLVGFGHSMGGACLLMAAHRHPSLFSRLVVYEPIVFPPDGSDARPGPSLLAVGARRRRESFASFDAALTNFSSKPPLSGFTPAALEAYVRYGFREGEDGQVHLKCRPEIEAATFEMSRSHDTWDVLPDIKIPVLIACGLPLPDSPAQYSQAVADRLANCTYVQLDDLDHFGPMTHPAIVAELLLQAT
ncbi:MAG: alpha/beta hydrolase [Ilumatobacteraceae bacterium]